MTDTITNVMIHYNTSRRNVVPDKKLKYKTTVETLLMIKSSRKETKLLESTMECEVLAVRIAWQGMSWL